MLKFTLYKKNNGNRGESGRFKGMIFKKLELFHRLLQSDFTN